MAYTKQTWADLPSKTTPINAERLTHIEDGIFNAAQTADTAASTAGTAAANVGIVSSKVETLTERVNGLDTAVSNKVDKVTGKGLSTNDYTNTDKAKVDALGTASTKNSTSVVTDSTDLVESGAVKDIVGWGNKNKNSGDVNRTFIKDTARTFQFPISIPIVNGHKYKFVADVSAISGYKDTGALGFRIAKTGGDISNTYSILTTAQGQQVIEMTATGSADSGAYVYCFIPNTEGNNATITLSNVMVVEETVTDYTYEPYHESVEDTLRDAEVIEGKNLISGALFSSGSANVSVSVNADKSVLFTGKANGTTRTPTISENFTLKAGTYILNGCKGGSANTYGLRVGLASTGNEVAICYDGDVSFTLNADTEVKMIGRLSANYTDTYNVTMYPMIRKVTETDATFKPYYIPLKDVVPNKSDNSVIGTVEGANASKAWSVGEHFIQDGQFKEVTQAIASGGAISDSNTTNKPIAELITSISNKLKYYNIRLSDIPDTGTVENKCTNVANQLYALVTDIGIKFTGYVLWTSSMFLRVEAIRCNATTLLFSIFNASYIIYQGNVDNGVVHLYKIEGGNMS